MEFLEQISEKMMKNRPDIIRIPPFIIKKSFMSVKTITKVEIGCFLAKSWPEYIFTHSSDMRGCPNTIWDISKTLFDHQKPYWPRFGQKTVKIMHYWDPGSSSNSMNSLIFVHFIIYDFLHFYLGQNDVSYYEKLLHGQPSIKDFNFGHHSATKFFLAKSWPRCFYVKS